ncbi:potassium transporter [Penicillium verhagenii]|uniref:potassium transporter n=1 Tax=Penicillium verhagenii TaxID=1562060 RepID=UPI0025457803|nr:potassium transporter [Penicillium verhagenii]KAJ5939101.1 potassium transporter [Penicillium verhagenii]
MEDQLGMKSPPASGPFDPSDIPQKPEVTDVEMNSVFETTHGEERDYHRKQVFQGWKLAWLTYQSLGVIYGDIGTSPLYVYSSTFSSEPSYDDILGAVSLVIWALTIMVTIKYVFIVLCADDEGEGGTFAVYSLLSRYANLVRYDPRHQGTVRMERFDTNDLRRPNSKFRSMLERSTVVKWVLKVVGAFGVALLLADGVLTPAQSVLGAIQGVTVVNPNVSTSTVVGTSCAILVLVFAIQPFGTTRIASAFAPIVILWMLFNLTFGIYNLAVFDASVFKAFSPYFAGAYLVRNKKDGWLSLGGILLAFTGVETLFADLGAFSRRSIQISWLFFVYPCLLISYIGQGAHISVNPSAYANPFFLTVPPGMIWPSLILAILACIVASQSVITGAYQLLSQIMKLSYFPRVKVYHTSNTFHGQVYIPIANWLMMIGTIVVTAVYNNTTRLGEAYGTCVILVSFLTTCMVTVVALIVWKLPVYVVLPVFTVFALWDGMFLSAALSKVPHGAWFTLMLALVLTCIFILWRYGKEEQWNAEESDNVPIWNTTTIRDNKLYLAAEGQESSSIRRTRGLGIFFDKLGFAANTPTVFLHFLTKFGAMPEITVFLHLRPLSRPTVPIDERYTVTRCFTKSGDDSSKQPVPNCYRLVVRHGYTDEIITPDLGVLVLDQIRNFLKYQDDMSEGLTGVNSEINTLDCASNSQVVYIVGKEQLKIAAEGNWFRRGILWLFVLIRDSSRSKVQDLNVAIERLVEVGFVKMM